MKSQLQIDQTPIAYTESGQGENTVVLLHCSASSSAQWRTLSGVLEQDFRVLAPDFYGYGESAAWPGHTPLTLAQEVAAVVALTERFEKPIHLVGHSYGGAVALKAALSNAMQLQSLTLIEPVAFHLLDVEDADFLDEILGIGNAVASALTSGDYHRGMQRFVDYWNGDGVWSQLTDDKRAALARYSSRVALDFWSTTTEETTLDACSELDVPTLILCGEHTPAPTQRITTLLEKTIPTTRQQTIAGAGHMLPLTHADVVNAAIAEHLARNSELEPLSHLQAA
ncbi:MAG: alpha/beta fold hydrolase [Acidiferrobacterales bacterium]